MDEAIRKHDFHALQQFLQTDFSDDMSHKCSKQFLNKLDKLICQVMKNFFELYKLRWEFIYNIVLNSFNF